jgi:HSP20 family protein
MSLLTKTETKPADTRRTTPVFLAPACNIRETKDGFILEAEMPGVGKGGIDITVENNELVIHGRRTVPELKGDLVHRESRWLDYRRVFDLDPSIDTTKINARIEQGLLTLLLPKTEQVKPKKVVVTD